MGQVSWLFNADFETQLFKKAYNQINSSKVNQEFEYLINYFDPMAKIYSLKKYNNEFLEHFKGVTGNEFSVTSSNKNVELWCNDFSSNPSILEYQSKLKFYEFMKMHNFHKHSVEIVKSSLDLSDSTSANFLYKNPYSVSGIGNLRYPENKKSIEKLLNNNIPLIKEKELNRTKDFSALIENREVIAIYENIIDKSFYYTGTIIEDAHNVLSVDQTSEYLNFLDVLIKELDSYSGVMSVDSFLYLENSKELLFLGCEVNLRKTMGYVACGIKKKIALRAKFFCFRIIYKKLKAGTTYEHIRTEFDCSVLQLSPIENRFQVFIFSCESRQEYFELEKRLLLKFF